MVAGKREVFPNQMARGKMAKGQPSQVISPSYYRDRNAGRAGTEDEKG